MSMLDPLHDHWLKERRAQRLALAIAPLIPRNASVLDVGCGDGQISARVLRNRPDLSIIGLDVLVRPEPAIPVHEFDGKELPFNDASVDAVLFVDVLHHTDDPE